MGKHGRMPLYSSEKRSVLQRKAFNTDQHMRTLNNRFVIA